MPLKPAKLPKFQGIEPGVRPNRDIGEIAPPGKSKSHGVDNSMTPDWLLKLLQFNTPDKSTLMDDQGNMYGPNNPFDNILKGLKDKNPEQGTMRNFINRMLSPTPMTQPTIDDIINGSVVKGTGNATSDNLQPTPEKNNKQPGMTPIPVPRNETDAAQPGAGVADLDPTIPRDTSNKYSMPTGIDPNMYDQLRESILRDSGQFDPNNANGLAGRMDGPYSKLDQRQGMEAADAISRMFRFRP